MTIALFFPGLSIAPSMPVPRSSSWTWTPGSRAIARGSTGNHLSCGRASLQLLFLCGCGPLRHFALEWGAADLTLFNLYREQVDGNHISPGATSLVGVSLAGCALRRNCTSTYPSLCVHREFCTGYRYERGNVCCNNCCSRKLYSHHFNSNEAGAFELPQPLGIGTVRLPTLRACR